ncbi:hypothetical protein ST201phi2-1p464 [Pseudomonas phage 201phi2-1]|uniref:Uncharacterized protein n=1 Tax=Pseudomonas phage 201phi2-1 TaxID=198110 RepID=B3FJX2_BP201|nr:hypothetical protein ST201phi2-1p464 [Pseudomonas phage 201phi2-1]ABY63287.1 hypothetical protein 201phi2-1p464 [Pseudomonas phage 201phi2-1]
MKLNKGLTTFLDLVDAVRKLDTANALHCYTPASVKFCVAITGLAPHTLKEVSIYLDNDPSTCKLYFVEKYTGATGNTFDVTYEPIDITAQRIIDFITA